MYTALSVILCSTCANLHATLFDFIPVTHIWFSIGLMSVAPAKKDPQSTLVLEMECAIFCRQGVGKRLLLPLLGETNKRRRQRLHFRFFSVFENFYSNAP